MIVKSYQMVLGLANLPAGTALQDSLGNIIPEMMELILWTIDENGEQTVTLIIAYK